MNGIVNVLKPAGMTSHDMVDFFRKTLNIEKAGHTGTLDPWAAGVLPVCVGKATRVTDYIMRENKVYRAGLVLGMTTDTLDSQGTVTGRFKVDVDDRQVIEAVKSFKGIIWQVPPMFSAIKVDGRKLCDMAREGRSIEREPRRVEIHRIDVISVKIPEEIIIDVDCSKGTYIRSLCADIGEKLGCGAYMSFLVRTRTGMFDIDHAYTVEKLNELKKQGKIEEAVLPVDTVLGEYGKVVFNQEQLKRFMDGVYIRIDGNCDREIKRVYGPEGFVALGRVVVKDSTSYVRMEKMLS